MHRYVPAGERSKRMNGFWKKFRRKTAVVLTTAMMISNMTPMTGMAKIFDLGLIDDQDMEGTLDDYVATASVAAKVDTSRSDSVIEVASGSDTGTADIVAQIEVDVTEVATASDALASPPDWSAVKDEAAQAIAANVSMGVEIRPDEAIKNYVAANTDNLYSDGQVTVTFDAAGAAGLSEGEYSVRVEFTPDVTGNSLPEGIVVSSIKSAVYELTVIVGSGAADVTDITFKDFGTGEKTGKTWIYVEDEPVDLRDYCEAEGFDIADVSFSSSDPSVASIDGTVMTPTGRGTAVITAEIEKDGQVVASGQLTVDVWITEETSEAMPPAFELYEGGTWQYTFKGSIAALNSGFTAVYKEDGTVADEDTEARVKIISHDAVNNTTTVEVKGKKAGKYTLKCAWHGGVSGNLTNTTQYGYVDFNV